MALWLELRAGVSTIPAIHVIQTRSLSWLLPMWHRLLGTLTSDSSGLVSTLRNPTFMIHWSPISLPPTYFPHALGH